MTDLELFFADSVNEISETEYVVSERFKDKDGNPIPWKLRPISAEKNNEIKKKSTKTVQVTGKPGQFRNEFDNTKYATLLTTETVVFPNLNSADLQESWSKKAGFKIMDADVLLTTMLLAGEYDNLTAKVMDVNGYADINAEVEEAKN